jgi:hypothetical protein
MYSLNPHICLKLSSNILLNDCAKCCCSHPHQPPPFDIPKRYVETIICDIIYDVHHVSFLVQLFLVQRSANYDIISTYVAHCDNFSP